jgi:hypothetical protein
MQPHGRLISIEIAPIRTRNPIIEAQHRTCCAAIWEPITLSDTMCWNSKPIFFSRSTIATRCTHGQLLKLTSRYFAMATSHQFSRERDIVASSSASNQVCFRPYAVIDYHCAEWAKVTGFDA